MFGRGGLHFLNLFLNVPIPRMGGVSAASPRVLQTSQKEKYPEAVEKYAG
jgi:hypothetical protein